MGDLLPDSDGRLRPGPGACVREARRYGGANRRVKSPLTGGRCTIRQVSDGLEQPERVTELLAAFAALREVVRSTKDPHAAFQLATAVEGVLRGMNDEWSNVRAETVVRIRDAEATSLAVLATRIGVSKKRAHDLLKRGEAAAERTEQ